MLWNTLFDGVLWLPYFSNLSSSFPSKSPQLSKSLWLAPNLVTRLISTLRLGPDANIKIFRLSVWSTCSRLEVARTYSKTFIVTRRLGYETPALLLHL